MANVQKRDLVFTDRRGEQFFECMWMVQWVQFFYWEQSSQAGHFFFFLHQKRVGEWLCHEVYRKAVDVVVVLHT